MDYRQFLPHPRLAAFIDAYWMVTGNAAMDTREKILPDGCIDIILNAGENYGTDDSGLIIKSEEAYLIGTMTRFKHTVVTKETKLIGIRFKPGGFKSFYNFCNLSEITDHTMGFDKKLTPDLKQVLLNAPCYLDRFFLEKLSLKRDSPLAVIDDIRMRKGHISVSSLARTHCTTEKQLQRKFTEHLGIGPKEFINLTRYQYASQLISQKTAGRTLQDIAFTCGYYDQAHLTNDIKKYTGTTPSLF